MASSNRQKRNARKRRVRRAEKPAAATPNDSEGGEVNRDPGANDRKGRSGKDKKKPASRLSAAIDRMEETADERPPAPWGNFPLGPLSVLAGLILIIIGAIGGNPVQLAIGCGLGALGGLELSIREHFAGFRSHTTLLAGFIFVIVVGVSYFAAGIVLWACLLIGLALAAPTFWWLRKRFEKASGGLTYKLR